MAAEGLGWEANHQAGGGRGGDNEDVAKVTDVADVLHARRDFGVGREGEDEGMDKGVGGEKSVKDGEVLGRVHHGEGKSAEGELVDEVQVARSCGLALVRGILVRGEVETPWK